MDSSPPKKADQLADSTMASLENRSHRKLYDLAHLMRDFARPLERLACAAEFSWSKEQLISALKEANPECPN